MDFFEYASIASLFSDAMWLKYFVGGLCFAVVYVFQAVALFVISGREGLKNRWMAFVPFFNTYYIGVCAQKNRCLGKIDTKIVSLIAAMLEVVLFAGYLVNDVAFELLRSANLIEYPAEDLTYGFLMLKTPQLSASIAAYPELYWAEWCFYNLSNSVLWWIELISLFLQVLVLSSFFQTYAARRYFLFTLTSVLFPVQGVLFFIVRNNRATSYRDYVRAEQERQYRMYQQYRQNNAQNPYDQNPYSRQDGSVYGSAYNRPEEPSAPVSDDDPFAEFGGKGSDPFTRDDSDN